MVRRKVQDDWLDSEYSVSDEKKPTIKQYLKELPKDVENIKSTVRVIWLPGRWNNYTLQCDHFRLIVSAGSELFNQLRNRVDDFTKGTKTLDVIVTDRAKVSYRLSLNNEEHGEWFFIGGDAGLKFTPNKGNSGDTEKAPW